MLQNLFFREIKVNLQSAKQYGQHLKKSVVFLAICKSFGHLG